MLQFICLCTLCFAIGLSGGEPKNKSIATFAGGCFWCVESDLEKLEGVDQVISGYAGGLKENPSYEEVSSGKTQHVEAVQVHFDPTVLGYKELVEAFWTTINPTDAGGQFNDRGPQYQTAIFVHDAKQREIAEASKKALDNSGLYKAPIVTPIRDFTTFYPAEEYHQNYAKNNEWRYTLYRGLSGRDNYLEEVDARRHALARPSQEELLKKLNPLQFYVTQKDGTEPPYDNEYWDSYEAGIYVDVVSGEPLFSSTDKYDSKTGWPSFTKPLEAENVIEVEHKTLFFWTETEVRSKKANSHLGHVFPDGPPPTGLRYCINSAALRFIPASDLEKEGYGTYRHLFTPQL